MATLALRRRRRQAPKLRRGTVKGRCTHPFTVPHPGNSERLRALRSNAKLNDCPACVAQLACNERRPDLFR